MCTGEDFPNSKFCVNMAYNYCVLSCLFQKAIAAQNPGMSREQRIELRNNKGHEMTFQRYHRYAGKCSAKFKVRAISRPTWFNHRNKRNCEIISYCVACRHAALPGLPQSEISRTRGDANHRKVKLRTAAQSDQDFNWAVNQERRGQAGSLDRWGWVQQNASSSVLPSFRFLRPVPNLTSHATFFPASRHSCSTYRLVSYGPLRVRHAVVYDCQATGSYGTLQMRQYALATVANHWHSPTLNPPPQPPRHMGCSTCVLATGFTTHSLRQAFK